MSKGSALAAVVFAFVCGVLVGNLFAGGSLEDEESVAEVTEEAAAEEEAEIERFRIPVTPAQPAKGAKDALVTIVEYSDFQCPFCTRVEPTITQLLKDYAGKLRVVWRNNPLPFHRDAMLAAEAALEAKAQGGDEKFWQYHKLLFDNQRNLKREDLEKYANQVGLDAGKFKEALDQHKHKRKIEADMALGKRMGARGTPAFFINGRFLSGAQPASRFKDIIDDELKRAEKLLEAGTPKNRIYATLTKKGLTRAKAPEGKDKRARRRPDPNAVYKVPLGSSPQKGPKDALVTIVEFSDFQCPFCKRVNPTMDQIVKEYGRDVRIVFKQNALPFHKDAPLAAEASLAAGAQGKFWQMHDKLFENQRALKREDLDKYAKELGLNMPKFKKALDERTYKAQADEEQKLARSLGASGTPAFFINGRNLRGAQPFQAFKRVIDEELKKAKDLVAKGTKRNQIYEKVIANGATTPQFIEVEGKDDSPAARRPDPDKVYKIPVPAKAPRKGGRNAKVVIQEFSDFQCPFCSRVNPTVEQIAKEYGDKVAIVWRHYPLPFHQQAKLAAEAAHEVFAQAGSKKFWEYHDVLFKNQRALGREDLEKYAQALGGVDMGRFRKALDAHTHAKTVEGDMEAVKNAGARIGTPSFFINGKLLQGAQPFPKFKAVIDEALAGG